MVSNSVLLAPLDKIDFSFRAAEAASRQTVLYGLLATLPAPTTVTAAFLSALLKPTQAVYLNANPDALNKDIYKDFFQSLNAFLGAQGIAGVTTLDQYASYQNSPTTGTRNSFLVAPNAALLYWLYASNGLRTPSALMQPGNVFAPQTTFANATIGAAGAVTAGLTGSVIKTANDTSGTPQGYVPAPGLLATATVTVSGSELLSVTYSGQTGAGVPFTGHVGTLDVGSLAAGGTTPGGNWTPAAAGERVSAVTAITVTGSPTATSGAVTVVSQLERITS